MIRRVAPVAVAIAFYGCSGVVTNVQGSDEGDSTGNNTAEEGLTGTPGGDSGTLIGKDDPQSGTTSENGGDNVGPLDPLDPDEMPEPETDAEVIPNIDSAIINIDPVEGARDYRAFVMEDGVEVLTDDAGHEVVNGATIFCAGQRQRAAPALPEPEVMTQIEVTGLTEGKTFVVEALDRPCPFPGLHGKTDAEVHVGDEADIAFDGKPVPVLSEESIRERYGSMIINGHGPADPSNYGQPAEPTVPRVLERWTVEVEPLSEEAASARRTRDFFSTFDTDDQPTLVRGGDNPGGSFHAPDGFGYSVYAYQNQEFSFYATNVEQAGLNHLFLDRGTLHMLLPDAAQDVMGTTMAIPKKPAQLFDDSYLHVTFETSTNSTQRRYWWLSLCGAETAGETFDAQGLLKEWIILGSGFFNRDGRNMSVADWNCLVVFPHDGIMTAVPPGSGENPQSSIMAVIHKANQPTSFSAVNVSPQQLNDGYPPAWFRRHDGDTVTTEGVLDDYIQRAPRVKFDMYISRDRLVMYVNDEQQLCNGFGPERLTMAEAAVGFNDALYHSSAEHTEMQMSFADRTGQLYYLQNSVFADQLTYDNVGFEEGVSLPSSFSDEDCYTHTP